MMKLLQIKRMQVIENDYCNVLARIAQAEMNFYTRRMKNKLLAIVVYLRYYCHNNLISSLRSNQFLLLQSLGERKQGYCYFDWE